MSSVACVAMDRGPIERPDPERACHGLDQQTRSQSVLAHGTVADIDDRHERVGKQRRRVARGADIAVHAEPNSNPAYLERRARCEIAQNRAWGEASPTHASDSPLAVKDVDVRVERRGPYMVFELRSDTPESARSIQERARTFGHS
ncbi:MAG: hypothetical protein AAGF11_29650 [Myxococcota bacterium]